MDRNSCGGIGDDDDWVVAAPNTAPLGKTKRKRKKKRPPALEFLSPEMPSSSSSAIVSAITAVPRPSAVRRKSDLNLNDPLLLASGSLPDGSTTTPVRQLLKACGDSFHSHRTSETVAPEATSRVQEPASPALTPHKTIPGVEDEVLQTFSAYIFAEAHPEEKRPTPDVVWGQTERDKVYNFLLYVPYQLERVVMFGGLICFDSFLASITLLPCRAVYALATFLGSNLIGGKKAVLAGSQLFDILCAAILLASTLSLLLVKPGSVYYWMKDITSEFLKIQVVFSALEMLDKILTNFGVDVMEALSATCTLWLSGVRPVTDLISDTLVAFAICSMHGVVLMAQAIVISVAMTSKKNALVALLIASNFVEVKGTIYKRMDANKIWALVCLDIVERFHLMLTLLFVVVEDMGSSASFVPSGSTLRDCFMILGSEVVIDIVKHSVLGKFNDVRPGVYREYMKDLCERATRAQSHNTHRLVGFFPYGCTLLMLRMAITLVHIDIPGGRYTSWLLAGTIWLFLLLCKPVFGYLLKLIGDSYVNYYTRHYSTKHPHRASAKANIRTDFRVKVD